jgi:hypothetical protein
LQEFPCAGIVEPEGQRFSPEYSLASAGLYATLRANVSIGSSKGSCSMNLLTTFKGSMMEGFLPAGWDLAKIDRLADHSGEAMVKRAPWWNPKFEPVACATLADFDTYMGHEIAREIQLTRAASTRRRAPSAG